ncbi:hypothetical protein AMECASPLE_022797 [Ameca splendens]|uniref:Secreted protein n=1 Tax=Ameca splendens TaxID=208324 RepID=A0ABV0Z1X7_9TELE
MKKKVHLLGVFVAALVYKCSCLPEPLHYSMSPHETFSDSFVFRFALYFSSTSSSTTQMCCSYVTFSLPAFGSLARHAFTLQAKQSRVWINHAETGRCNHARVRFSDPLQSLEWVHIGMIRSRTRPWHCTKRSKGLV